MWFSWQREHIQIQWLVAEPKLAKKDHNHNETKDTKESPVKGRASDLELPASFLAVGPKE